MCQQKESRQIMKVETEWNNSVNKSHIEFHDFIYSGLNTISLLTIRSEERQLDDSYIRRQRYSGTPPYGDLVNTGHLVIMAKFFLPIDDRINGVPLYNENSNVWHKQHSTWNLYSHVMTTWSPFN